MAGLKSLAKDTAVYGLSSIIGKFLNYLLVPLHTAVLAASSGEYGIVSNMYAFTALMLVFLTFGMETGFFRFANKSDEDPLKVYSNALFYVGALSFSFLLICLTFLPSLSSFLGYHSHPEFVGMIVIVVSIDAFLSIPFAFLRYKKRPLKFAGIKLFSITLNILLNLFFLLGCPWLQSHYPSLIAWFYRPDYLVGYIFLTNVFTSVIQLLFFIPEFKCFSFKVDKPLLKRMIHYSFPILILGLVGVLNQSVDKMIYPFLFADRQEGLVQLGVYGAACKVAMVMAMFTQAFRYAYEPFVFGKNKESDGREMYASAMKYFLIFSLLAFLSVMFYLDIIKHLINREYWAGLSVVAIVMMAEIIKGIYFNLSFWYKLIDETRWGAYFSIVGCVVIISINVWCVPLYGFVASAWASVLGYAIITLLSYVIGQKKYPIAYDLKRIGFYVLLTGALYLLGTQIQIEHFILRLAFRTFLLILFVIVVINRDLIGLKTMIRKKIMR